MRSCISEIQTIGNWSDVAAALSLSNSLNCTYLHSNWKYTFFTDMSSVAATHIRITARCEGEERANRGIKTWISKQAIHFPTLNGAVLLSLSHTMALVLKAVQHTDINFWQQERGKLTCIYSCISRHFYGEKTLVQFVLLGVSSTSNSSYFLPTTKCTATKQELQTSKETNQLWNSLVRN